MKWRERSGKMFANVYFIYFIIAGRVGEKERTEREVSNYLTK